MRQTKRKPFPKPILIGLQKMDDRSIARWLFWRLNQRWTHQLDLVLGTLSERGSSERVLWSTCTRKDAAAMAKCIKTSTGYIVNDYDLLNAVEPSGKIWHRP